jgi:ribonuclease P/MRP protein subunit POP7
VIYISASTPFISAVKRVDKYLQEIEKREGSSGTETRQGRDWASVGNPREAEEVVLKATNRAIEKALSLCVFFQGRGNLRVKVRTGSVGAVDDIVEEDEEVVKKKQARRAKEKGKGKRKEGVLSTEGGDKMDIEDATTAGGDTLEAEKAADESSEDVEMPEARVRMASTIEIAISLI